jgi:hypothetical protein
MSVELCPKCRIGYLRPTQPDRETGSMRFFVCDNCGFKKPEGESNEYIPIGETSEMKVIKANTNENNQDNTKDTADQ